MTTDSGNRELRDGMLTLRVSDDAGRVIALSGELDMANASTLATELEKAEETGAESILIDMSELEFIDSTGIAVIVAAHRRLNADAARLQLIRSEASEVCRVMDVTGLHRELPFVAPE